MRRTIATLAVAVVALALAGPAAAATGALFGGATLLPDGSVRLVSDLSNETDADNFSGIDFTFQGPFESLKTLSTQYHVTDDDCLAGSPRFQLNVEGKNVFVYLGPSPGFTGCAQGTWLDSGNLVGNDDACRWDTSQLAAGTQCNTYSGALALLAGKQITGVQLVVDSGWAFADKEQTVLVRNVRINGQRLFGPLNPARACKAQRAAMGVEPFKQLYGTNRNKANAFGKCVAAMAKARRNGTGAERQQATLSASRSCKAARASNPAAFRARYGVGARALGRCVSAQAQAKATPAGERGKGKGKGRR